MNSEEQEEKTVEINSTKKRKHSASKTSKSKKKEKEDVPEIPIEQNPIEQPQPLLNPHGLAWEVLPDGVNEDRNDYRRHNRTIFNFPPGTNDDKSIWDIFSFSFPMPYLTNIVKLTNNNLGNNLTSAGELLKYFGIRLAMSREPTRGGIDQYWGTKKNNDTVDIPKNYGERFNMGKSRFKSLSKAFTLANPTEEELQNVLIHYIS
jgi:hypothetical protein